MIYVKSASFFIGLISFFIAYLAVVTFANAFRAWVAYKMGDYTARADGFLSLNPLVHIDTSSVALFFMLYYMGIFFGWGRYVPINPDNIEGKWNKVCTFLAGSMAEFGMALLGIIALIGLFDIQIIPLTQYMVLSRNMSHLYLAHVYPDASSLVIAVGFILISFVYLATLLGVFSLIIDGCHLGAILSSGGDESGPFFQRVYPFKNMLIPLILMFFFSEGLRYMATTLIVYVGYVVTHIIGLI